jgi:hypothetical protein
MWYLLVMVALPIQLVDEFPVFVFHKSFETSPECVLWANNNTTLIARTIMTEYPEATGHNGIYCASEESLTKMHKDGVLTREIQGESI